MEDYYLVTAIFDVKRHYPGVNRWRSASKYIELFNYFYELKLPTILFIEDHLVDKIKPADHLHIISKNMTDLPAYQYIKDKNNLSPIINGKHLNKEFTSIINSKIYLMNEAKKIVQHDNKITHLVWLDAGIGHIGVIEPEEFKSDIALHLHENKIMNVLMKGVTRGEVENLSSYLQWSKGKIAAGLITVPLNMVEWYHNELWNHYIYSVDELKLLCYEEQLMSIPVGRYPDKFDFSFSDYGLLKNLRYIKHELSTVLTNLTFCRENGLSIPALKMVRLILTSVNKGKLYISKEDCCQFLYDAQIVTFYHDSTTSKMMGIFLGYMYYYTEEGKRWIDARFNNIKDNLKYVNLDLENADLFEECKTFELDVYDFLWKIF